MTKPIIRIHNLATDEVLDREMTNAEFAQYKADETSALAREAEVQAKATARQVILDRLGLTADEAQLLLGGN